MDSILFDLILGGVGGAITHTLLNQRRKKKETPYRWGCPAPDCHYAIQSSDPTWTLRMALIHEENHQ